MAARVHRIASSAGSASAPGPAVLAAMVLAATACARSQPDATHAVAAVRANLVAQGLEVGPVTCLPAATGASTVAAMVCQAHVDGRALRMRVATDASAVGLRVTPMDPIVVVSKVQPQIEAATIAQGFAVASIHCDASVWQVHAGAVHRCHVTEAAGTRWIYEATFSGDALTHTARLVPATTTPHGAGG